MTGTAAFWQAPERYLPWDWCRENIRRKNGERLAALLEITAEDIQAALEQSWVTEDTFVPLKKIGWEKTMRVWSSSCWKSPGS